MTDTAVIRRSIDRVPADLVAKARQFQASILADVGGRRGTLHGRIQPLAKSMKVGTRRSQTISTRGWGHS